MRCNSSLPPPISTHALREEGDMISTPIPAKVSEFLPTPSVRRATRPKRTSS